MTQTADGVRRDRWATTIRRIANDSESVISKDVLAVEEPLEIRLRAGDDERAVSVTMRTPGDDESLAVGFLFCEGIFRTDSVEAIDLKETDDGKQNIVVVTIAPSETVDFDRLARNFYTTSSCGVCGKSSLEAIAAAGAKAVESGGIVNAAVISGLAETARHGQSLFDETGGLHAAALFDFEGRLIDVKEDVGRHNALDKLIGKQFLEHNIPCRDRVLFLSGRASFELMQKAVMAGIAVVCAVGAPSSLAVATAREFGVTLCGFVRDGRFNIYSGEDRIHVEN